MRRVQDDRPLTAAKQEPGDDDDDQPPLTNAIQTTDSQNTVDQAFATLSHFESLK